MIFRTRSTYDEVRKARKASPSGTKIVRDLKLDYDEKGRERLVVCGEKDVYADVQAYKDGCIIQNIVRRYLDGATDTGIGVVQVDETLPVSDFTTMPKTMMEAHNIMVSAERSFAQFPAAVKREYHNNWREFLAAFDSGEFAAKFGLKDNKVKEGASNV